MLHEGPRAGEEGSVHADAGYILLGKREEMQGRDLVIDTAKKCSEVRGLAEAKAARAEGRSKANVRAIVEHPLHAARNLSRNCKGHDCGLAKNTAQLFSLFALANLVLAMRLPPQQEISSS